MATGSARKVRVLLEYHRWTSSSEEFVKSAKDAQGLITLANHYGTYRLVMNLWETAVQIGFSGERLQRAVCQSVIVAYRQRPGLAAVGIEVLEAGMPNFPQGLALSVYLTAHAAVHTSLHKNLRLRAGIDELRMDGESRFSRLLKELPAEVLAAYQARVAGWGDLMDVRTEAARRLEKAHPQPNVQDRQELATFAAREAALKKSRLAGLTPREHELFKFFLENPGAKNAEAARELGVAEGTVRSLKSRIKRTLDVA
jgi:DNA-binding CsgD family transcriptional regulator